MMKKLMSCVLPGVALVLTRLFRCRSALMRDDLPTFERPAKATWGLESMGNCFGPGALMTNSAERIFMGEKPGVRSQEPEARRKVVLLTPEYRLLLLAKIGRASCRERV